MAGSVNAVAAAIDGATGDWSMSGDAMRWSPEPAECGAESAELLGPDVCSGVGLDLSGVRRLVSGALTSLGAVAGDVVTELRQLALGPSPGPPAGDDDRAPVEG
jgi:hypothetical protein